MFYTEGFKLFLVCSLLIIIKFVWCLFLELKNGLGISIIIFSFLIIGGVENCIYLGIMVRGDNRELDKWFF